MTLRSGFAVCLLLCAAALPTASTVLPGAQPPTTLFEPDLDVFPQNFAIAVDDASNVFLGNSDGVLVFDGEYWAKVALPNEDIVRTLHAASDTRVYVGGYDAFGFIERGATGQWQYTELSDRVEELGEERFADIWEMEVASDAVYFVGLEHLFRFDPDTGEVQMWLHEGSFGPVVEFGGRVIVQFRGEGLKYFDGGRWHPTGGPDLSRILLSGLVPVAPDEMLVIGVDGPWYRYDGVVFSEIPEAETIPFKATTTHAIALDERHVALTTPLGLVVLVDLATYKAEVVEAANGFVPDAVVSREGNLLIVDDLGFVAIPWPPAWRGTGGSAGLAGTINTVEPSAGEILVMSSSGAFVQRAGADRFERLPWTDYEAWDVLPLESGGYLFADSYSIVHLLADGTEEVIDNSTTAREFVRSEIDPDVVYVGTEFGVQVLKRDDDSWTTVYRNDDMDNMRVTEIVERGPDEIWVGSDRGGVRRLAFTRGEPWQANVSRFEAGDGLEYGDRSKGAYLFELDGVPVASTAEGFFRWNGERFERTDLDGLEAHRVPGRTMTLATDGNQRWAFDFSQLLRFDGAWKPQDLGELGRGAFSSISFIDGEVVVGMLGVIATYSATPDSTDRAAAPAVRVTAATLLPLDGGAPVDLDLNDIEFGAAAGRFIVRYAWPAHLDPASVEYRTRLLPSETQFSPWSGDSQQAFVQLAPGDYRLAIEARRSGGPGSTIEIPITVTPRWFETVFAQALFLLLTVLALAALMAYVIRRRSRLLEAERDRLDALVTERTRELRSANRQLESMAHLDGLTQIPNRRRLDGYLEDVRQQCVERHRQMGVALIDVDHFKRFNDSFGHQAGDALLVDLARLLSRNLRRAEDLVARYGGEEFVVVLPGADRETAYQVIEGMRQRVEDSGLGITISAGVHVTLPDETATVADIVRVADESLFRAKDAGRNRVIMS